MERPLIAVTAAIELLPSAFGVELDCTKLGSAYTDAIYAAGGQPVVLPVTPDPPNQLLNRMDGLLITGGGDIDPALYGEEPAPGVYGIREERDSFETQLYQEAVALGLPVLALCRGMQLINVLRGGSLHQNLESDLDHWQQYLPDYPAHKIDVIPGTTLAHSFGDEVTVSVNSYHHQGVKDLGSGLQVTAVCGDVIEAVEAVDADILAVQWHPEHLIATDPQQKALFEAFVQRASVSARINTAKEK